MPRRKPDHPAPASPSHARIDGERLVAHLIHVEAKVLELQRELEHAQRLAVLGTLTAGIAHEFNNLMTPVLSYAQMALEARDDQPLARKALERAAFGATSACRIASAILSMAKDQPRLGEPEPDSADVGEAVRNALAVIARDPARDNIDLILNIPDGLRARIRPIALQQSILNLVLNALRAMKHQGGSHTLKVFALARTTEPASHAPTDTGTPAEAVGDSAVHSPPPCSTWNMGTASSTAGVPPVSAGRGEVEIVIEDSGPGFDPAAVRPQGHGLGLKISRRMLEEAQGSLTIQSPLSPAGGTRCTITIPLA